jgi:hypothetical protein
MRRVVPALALALAVWLIQSSAPGAPPRERRAYKPAERRQQEAEAQAAQAAQDAGEKPAATYDEELEIAKEKRDRDLQDATDNETSRRKLEERRQEIFAQYAAIVAALKDKYEAAHPDEAATAKPNSGKKPKAGRAKPAGEQAPDDKPRGRGRKGREPAGALADAQEKLDAENARHDAKLDQLNAQLEQAESSGNQRAVSRARKAIEKENNSYDARKKILERRVVDLGGTLTPPPDAKEPAKDAPAASK